MEKNLQNQTLALAGLLQAGRLVSQIARRGMADSEPMQASLGSIMQTDAETAADVFAGIEGVEMGLQQIVEHLAPASRQRDMDITRYVITLLALERKLARNGKMLDAIGRGIEEAQRQQTHFGLLHENTMAKLADIYLNSISTLTPRVMVNGEPHLLANPDNANRIRALLLAGIRAAVLWRQAGGNRWRLLLRRGSFADEATRLLAQINR